MIKINKTDSAKLTSTTLSCFYRSINSYFLTVLRSIQKFKYLQYLGATENIIARAYPFTSKIDYEI